MFWFLVQVLGRYSDPYPRAIIFIRIACDNHLDSTHAFLYLPISLTPSCVRDPSILLLFIRSGVWIKAEATHYAHNRRRDLEAIKKIYIQDKKSFGAGTKMPRPCETKYI